MGESGKWGRQIQLLRFDRRIKITSMGWFGVFVLCLIGILHAEIVEWTAEGAVTCPLYTSDAADDLLCVELGGCCLTQKKISLFLLIVLL